MKSLFSPDFKLPEDGFIHLAPLGEFRRRVVMPDGAVRDITQVVDAAAVEAMAADVAHRASIKDWPGILLDADHGANKPDGSSRAFGWITSAQARPDGLWGKVRWTKVGADAVAGGEFRFVSPTWRLGIELQEIAPDRFRPVSLWRCSVTNDSWFVERGPGMVPIAELQFLGFAHQALTSRQPPLQTHQQAQPNSVHTAPLAHHFGAQAHQSVVRTHRPEQAQSQHHAHDKSTHVAFLAVSTSKKNSP
jgi:hypothetical protein